MIVWFGFLVRSWYDFGPSWEVVSWWPPSWDVIIPWAGYPDLGLLELVANLATRWRHLPFANRKLVHYVMPHPLFAQFGHQMELFALIANLATMSISCKLGPQVAQLALVQNLVISWHHLHCFQSWPPVILALLHCLQLPFWHYQLVLSWYPHQPESHQLSLHKGLLLTYSLTHWHPDPKIGPQVYLGPIKMLKWGEFFPYKTQKCTHSV